jgi:hypothetical protein
MRGRKRVAKFRERAAATRARALAFERGAVVGKEARAYGEGRPP